MTSGGRQMVHSRDTTTARALEWAIPLLLLAACLGQVARPLNFDEGVYFTIARDIGRLHVPAIAWDGETYELFSNSPALVLYLGALFQHWSPHANVVITRLVIASLFVVWPTLVLWSLLRHRYGVLPAAAGISVPFITWTFLDEAFRFRLDVPLGVTCAVTLLYYYRASRSEGGMSASLCLAMVLTAASVWIKFQAVCVVAAVLAYWCYVRLSGRKSEVPGIGLATAAVVLAAVLGVAGWIGFSRVATELLVSAVPTRMEPAGVADVLARNWSRIAHDAFSAEAAKFFVQSVLQPLVGRVGFLVGLVVVAWAAAGRLEPAPLLAAMYCAMTVLFNLAMFRMPGAGSYYLVAAVPSVCVVVAWAVSAVQLSPLAPRLKYAALLMLGLHAAMNVPRVNQLFAADWQRSVAEEIIHNAPAGAIAVSAQLWAIGYYSGRPLVHLDEISSSQAREMFTSSPRRVAAVVVTEPYLHKGGRRDVGFALESDFSLARTIAQQQGGQISVFLAR